MPTTVTYGYSNLKNNFQLNSWETGDQINPDVTRIGDGGFVVVYTTDLTNDYSLLNYYDNNYDQDGSHDAPYDTFNPDQLGASHIATLNNGNVVIVWDEGAAENGDDELVASIWGPTGSVVVSEFTISSLSTYVDPNVAALANGGFVVSWEFSGDLRHSVYDSAGSLVDGINPTSTSGVTTDHQVAGLAGGGYVVTYTSGGTALRAAIFEDNGDVRTADFGLDSFGTNAESAVAALPNGNWAVVYSDSGWTGDGVTLKIFDEDGNDVSGFIRVDTDINDVESNPAITVLDNGYIFVTWTDDTGVGSSNDVVGRLFDQNGTAITLNSSSDAFTIAGFSTNEDFSSVAAIGGGELITAWQTDNADGDGGSVEGEVGAIVRTTVGDGGNQNIEGDSLIDDITGLGGRDTLRGRDGDDTLDGGAGTDLIYGDNGDDSIRGGTENDDLRGSAGNDTIYGDNGRDYLRGNSDDDDLRGGSGGDTLDGGLDNDELRGASGDDTLNGRFGDDLLSAGIDDDLLRAHEGTDTLIGGDGNDTLYGNPGDDTMDGGNGDDDLRGGNDNDTLTGGNGSDTLRGNSGDDQFNFAFGDDDDEIIGFVAGAATDDVISISGFGASFDEFSEVAAVASNDGLGNTVIDFGTGDTITLIGVSAGSLDADDFVFV